MFDLIDASPQLRFSEVMIRRLLWRLKVRWPNRGRNLLLGIGLAFGAGAGWWLTLPGWQREDLVFRAKWAINHHSVGLGFGSGSASAGDRPYRYFTSCNEARPAGYGSMSANEPSYRPELDEDQDGIACEPWRGRGWRHRFGSSKY